MAVQETFSRIPRFDQIGAGLAYSSQSPIAEDVVIVENLSQDGIGEQKALAFYERWPKFLKKWGCMVIAAT